MVCHKSSYTFFLFESYLDLALSICQLHKLKLMWKKRNYNSTHHYEINHRATQRNNSAKAEKINIFGLYLHSFFSPDTGHHFSRNVRLQFIDGDKSNAKSHMNCSDSAPMQEIIRSFPPPLSVGLPISIRPTHTSPQLSKFTFSIDHGMDSIWCIRTKTPSTDGTEKKSNSDKCRATCLCAIDYFSIIPVDQQLCVVFALHWSEQQQIRKRKKGERTQASEMVVVWITDFQYTENLLMIKNI